MIVDEIATVERQGIRVVLGGRLASAGFVLSPVSTDNLRTSFDEGAPNVAKGVLGHVVEHLLFTRPVPVAPPGHKAAEHNLPDFEWTSLQLKANAILSIADDVVEPKGSTLNRKD